MVGGESPDPDPTSVQLSRCRGKWQPVNGAPSSERWTCLITRMRAFTGDVEVPGKLELFGGVWTLTPR